MYKILYTTSKDAIMLLTLEEGFFAGNDSTIKLFNCKDEGEFIKQAPPSLSPEMQPDGKKSSLKAKEMMLKALEEGSNYFHWTHKKLTGEEFPATVLLTRLDYHGKHALQATVRDITKEEEAEKALRKSEKRFLSMAKVVEVVFWMMSPDWKKMLFVSPAFEKIYGYSCEDLYKDPQLWTKVIHPEEREKVYKLFTEDSGKGVTLEYRIITKTGETKWVRDKSYHVLNKKGEVEFITGYSEDITEAKKAEEENKKFNKISIDREMRIIELKKEVNKYLKEAGQKKKYIER